MLLTEMIRLRSLLIPYTLRYIQIKRLSSSYKWSVEHLNKRTVLKLSGPDTNSYLQSMITNDIKTVDESPAIFSLLLNSNGRVLYDILLYKINFNEYLVEYDSSAFEYLHRHLLMYRLRKDVKIQPLKCFSAWVIHPEFVLNNTSFESDLKILVDHVANKEGVVTSVIDPRINLLGVRVITNENLHLPPLLSLNNFKFSEGNSYREYRYKLGIGEGVIDHPPGGCLPFDTNLDFLNGVSFSKGCYLGQELTAKMQFTLHIRKRLMPIELEMKDSYPEFPPECNIINEKNEKMGRLRSNLGKYGLALLKFEESLKSKSLMIKDFNIKLKANRPMWWPENI